MISGATQNNLVAAIADACRAGLDLDELRGRLLPRIRRAVPVDALWWAVADPVTLLFNRAEREGIPAETGPYFVANEFLENDVNKWTELARDRNGVRTLYEATGGEPESSARYRDIFKPLGLGDEMRAVLRADGECWGYVCMHREGPGGFLREEVGFVQRIAPHLADGFRLATLIGSTRVDDAPPPGVVVLGEDGSRAATNAAGERWLDELGADPERNELPLELLAVAARLQGVDGTEGRSARLRVRTRAGRWAVLHASWLGEPPSRSVAVIIEQAAPSEVLPVLLPAYGLTQQERRVTALICRGLSTIEIAAQLRVTTNTIQDHLKSIFTKTGVRSRRELVATLLKQQYH
ncbi:MAG TPA: LuxR C-terminal-related transcriptional regulator [Gaiellaceae bacterium]|nr:LuxR C-terminal-related transcriptional regulator [Gaiellaceae bacterium]